MKDNPVPIVPVPIVLAISDIGLRTVLTARLGMAGEMPISTADHRDPTLDPALRASALLIIEAPLIQADPSAWGEALRGECWSGRIVIVGDDASVGIARADGIHLVSRRHAEVGILALLQLWRSRPEARATAPE